MKLGRSRTRISDHVANSGDGPTRTNAPIAVVGGTLTAVGRGTEPLVPQLQALRDTFDETVTAYAAGNLDRTSTLLRLTALVCDDAAGVTWTIGAATRRWYVKSPGRPWRIAQPGEWADVPPPERPEDTWSAGDTDANLLNVDDSPRDDTPTIDATNDPEQQR